VETRGIIQSLGHFSHARSDGINQVVPTIENERSVLVKSHWHVEWWHFRLRAPATNRPVPNPINPYRILICGMWRYGL
jgi:hypothetical protein